MLSVLKKDRVELMEEAFMNRLLLAPKDRTQRGYMEVSFTKIFVIVLFVAGAWSLYQTWLGYYQKMTISEKVVASILTNSRQGFNDIDLATSVADELKKFPEIKWNPESDITIGRSPDGKRVLMKITYIRPVKIPLVDNHWNQQYELNIDEKIVFN